MEIKITNDEPIAFTLKRREIGLLSAVTNKGKSTLIRNALLALASGREFFPVVTEGKPRKVLLLDFESSIERLKPDLLLMASSFTEKEMHLVKENFFLMCEGHINNNPISLSLHLRQIEEKVISEKVDLIAVDTFSAAFELSDENNNTEVTRKALNLLRILARKANAALVIVHHIGKAGSESGYQSESAYRSRGASALGCFSTAIFNIKSDKDDESVVIVECAKRKDGKPTSSNRLRLDSQSRWFRPSKDVEQQPVNAGSLIISLLQSCALPLQRIEIVKALAGQISESSINRWLKSTVKKGLIVKLKHGLYALPQVEETESNQAVEKPDDYSIQDKIVTLPSL